jgi:GNAT superfamily N-acetyltransferase
MADDIRIERVRAIDEAVIEGLAEVTVDCVAGGASIGFLEPFRLDDAIAFWSGIADGIADGSRILFVARDSDGIVGTVQVILAEMPNQPHRADIAKTQVHRRARRKGVGAKLLAAAEAAALTAGRTILVLDTVTGTDAFRLYERLGYKAVGEIPDYALWPDGRLCPTTFFWKRLGPA